jgi:hypothetical protein
MRAGKSINRDIASFCAVAMLMKAGVPLAQSDIVGRINASGGENLNDVRV